MRTIAKKDLTDKATVYSVMRGQIDPNEELGFALFGCMEMTAGQQAYKLDPQNALKRFKCEHCNAKMQYVSKLSTHVKNKHMGWSYPCDECDKSFSSASALNTHKTSATKSCGAVERFKCSLCISTFTKSFSRDKHVQNLNEAGECAGQRMFVTWCDRNDARNEALNNQKARERKEAFDLANSRLNDARIDLKKKYRVFMKE